MSAGRLRQFRRLRTSTTLPRAALLAAWLGAASLIATGFWIPVKAEIAQILLERAWQSVRAGNGDARPWPWADTSPIARLSIPKLDAAWIVLSGASGRNLAFAPSHMDGSAMPGETGVTLIAGHRDTHFDVLEHVVPGDGLVVESASGATHRYRVTAIEIVDATKTRVRLDAPGPFLLLSTCYPFNAVDPGGPLRFVVQAQLIR